MVGPNMGMFKDHIKMQVGCMKDTALTNLEYIKSTAPAPGPGPAPGVGMQQQKSDAGIQPPATRPKFCPNCGAPVPAGNGKFCSECGHPLGPADPKQALVQAEPQEAASHQQNVAAANRMFQISQTQALSRQIENQASHNNYNNY